MTAADVRAVVEGPEGAPAVVLSNSLGTNLRMWDRPAAALRDRFRVVRYDTRGHGGSPVPPGPYQMADLGEDVVALLDRLGVPRASFAGISLGGMTGLWLGAHAPYRIDRLVVCSASARLGPASAWTERAATVRAQGTAAVADMVVARWLTPAFAAAEPATYTALRDMVASTPSAGYAACCEAIAGMDLRADLPGITAPTLVIGGQDDPATPPEQAREIAAGIPGSRLEILSPAAHLTTAERPDEVARLIGDHLAGGDQPD